ncbi:MAG: TlpA family protein disulfide reductase [Candidatus Dormibacteraeota bacterium]|nr:TlpA family protein disulfide reductase [Candidatus Dormibacteraeota bacterium]
MIESGGARDPLSVTRPVPRWALALPMLVVLIAAATAAGIVTLGTPARTASVSGGFARVGGTAPAFTSWDLSGREVELTDFKGHPVLITFWATWCTACQAELPELQRLRDRYQSAGLRVVAIDYRETNTARMTAYLTGLKVNLEALMDPQGTIAVAYGVDIGLPITVLLDRRGTVLQIIIGAASKGALETAVGQLAGPTTAP